MGIAFEVIAGRALNPGSTITAVTMDTGNSNTIRAFSDPAKAYIDSLWAFGATQGVVRARSPKMHDFVQGLRWQYTASTPRNLLSDRVDQPVFSQDTITIEISGGGAETDVACLGVYYTDAGGLQARLTDWDAIKARVVNIVTNEVTVTGPTTAGDWSAGTAINASNDNLKANTDYAVLGYTIGTNAAAVAIQGADTSNLRVGGPGTTEALETRTWFLDQNQSTGRPYIPVLNSANKGATLVSVCMATTGTNPIVDLVLAQLSP